MNYKTHVLKFSFHPYRNDIFHPFWQTNFSIEYSSTKATLGQVLCTATNNVLRDILIKGPLINDVTNFSTFSDPFSPSIMLLCPRFYVVVSQNNKITTPFPSLCDVIYKCILRKQAWLGRYCRICTNFWRDWNLGPKNSNFQFKMLILTLQKI